MFTHLGAAVCAGQAEEFHNDEECKERIRLFVFSSPELLFSA